MEKQAKPGNSNTNNFLKFKSSIPNVAEKFHDYYSEVYKERIVDYPMAIFSALVRVSLHRGL